MHESGMSGAAEPHETRPRGPIGRVGGYVAALALVALVNGAAAAAGARLDGGNLAMLYLTPVLLSAVRFGLGPALLAAGAAGVSYNFFHLAPRYTFQIGSAADLLTFSMFFAVALATGWLAGRVRDHARETARRSAEMGTLLEASRALSAAATIDEAAQALAGHVSAATGGAAIVLLPDGEGVRVAGSPAGLQNLSEANASAALRTWRSGEASVQPDAGWAFLQLAGLRGPVGVLGLRGRSAVPDAEGLLAALMDQGAAALERAGLASAAAENAALREADRLRSALLNSVSHDFRTPLATVLGSATTLLDYEAELKPSVRRDLLQSIAEEARRLNRYVRDLLDMSRLEAGALKPRREWTDVREVINAAIERQGDRIGERRIVRDFARDLSRVKADPALLEQALLNIIDNAVAYTPDGSAVEIAACEDMGSVLVSIQDEGPGIAPEALDRVFDKFRRLQSPSDRGEGLGLGLSIAKGFVEAMGGRIAAVSPVANRRGARFVVALPKSVRTPRDLL